MGVRFINFSLAYQRLAVLVELSATSELSDAEQEALVGRFGVTWELTWKLLNDYLQDHGVSIDPITPRAVVRAAFTAGLISSIDQWFEALEARNAMARTYNATLFQAVLADVLAVYHPVFDAIFLRFTDLTAKESA